MPISRILGTSRCLQYRKPVAAAGGWWLPTGVAAANCKAAYRSIGAADLATSLINLNSPGTGDAVKMGTGNPTWSAAAGWTCTGNQWLQTVPADGGSYSVFCRINNVDAGSNFNRIFGTTQLWHSAGYFDTHTYYQHGTSRWDGPGESHGQAVVGISGRKCYWNANLRYSTLGAWSGSITYGMAIGAASNSATTAEKYCGFQIGAFAVYDISISLAQVVELTASMLAL